MHSFKLSILAFICTVGASSAIAESWDYNSFTKGVRSGGGTVTLKEADGKATLRMALSGGVPSKCFSSELEASVVRTESTIKIEAKPLFTGCEEIRLVIAADGSGGKRYTKGADKWNWDGLDRGLTLIK